MTTDESTPTRKWLNMRLIAMLLVLSRGLLAIGLGTLVLVTRESGHLLGTFIGGYWMAAGFLSVGAGLRANESRPLIVAVGLFGVLAGALVETRYFWGDAVPATLFTNLLGGVAVLTGLLHLSGWMPVWVNSPGTRTRSGVLLGLFEIGLGAVLLIADVMGPVVTVMAIVWAFGGGLILIGEAITMWRNS